MQRIAFFVVIFLFASPAAFAMRCGNRLVDRGAQDFQVRDRCGEPFWTDSYTSVDVTDAYGPTEVQRTVQFDVWYYNFGPHQFMHQMVFRDGFLVRDETLGYGVDEVGGDCNPNRSYAGYTVGELYAHCGEPAQRRSETDTIVRRPGPGEERWRDQRRERWIYDFGDDRFVSLVQLVNGRVENSGLIHR
jgi:hypothetical protein